jgi:hypothetical protein
MGNWYRRVTADANNLSPLVDAISYFESELEVAKSEVKLKGSLEKASSRLPGITADRYNQLQEVEAILKYLNIRMDQAKGAAFKKYLEHYSRAMSSRDAEKYAEADSTVIDLALLINQVALVRNQYLGIMKGLDAKNWQISNLTRLKAAGFEDYTVDDNH